MSPVKTIGRLAKEILNHWAKSLFQPLYMVGYRVRPLDWEQHFQDSII